MKKALKYILITIVILSALFVTAAVILVATVDPNEYKSEIAQAVKEQTGRELVFEGDIGFNFFPWLGLKVGPMALGNAPGFSPKEMIRINKAEANIQIMPLFGGEIAIGMVVLDGFTLNLAKNAQGVSNLEDLGGKEQPEKAGTGESDGMGGEADDAKSSPKLEGLTVEGVEITGASVVYDDQQAGKTTSLTDLNLIIGEVGDKVRFPFNLSFNLKLDDPKLETRPELAGFAQFDLKAGTFDIPELALNILNAKLTGQFFAKSKDGNTGFSGELKLAELSLRQLMQQLGMEAPVTTDPKVLEKLSADLRFDGTDKQAILEKLTIKLDDTTISGNGSVKNFDKPAIAFEINVDDIDADRYMPPAAEKTENAQADPNQVAEGETAPAQEPDLSGLKELDLAGKLTIGKAKAMKATVTDILAQLRIKNGIATIKPFSAKLYQGTLEAESVLDANPAVATWTETAALRNVQVGPLLRDMTGKDHLLGTTVALYDVKGQGLTPDNIKKSISGTASFSFTDGAINGINIAKMLRDAFNIIKGKSAGPDEPQRTDFAELQGSAVIKKGHIKNDDLSMKSPLLRIAGNGWANLPKNSVDYTATVTVVGTLKGQDGASIEELSGLPLPIYVKGALDSPNIGLDAKAMAEALFKDTLKKGTKGLEDTLRKSILGGESKDSGTKEKRKPEEQLPGLIKGLFN